MILNVGRKTLIDLIDVEKIVKYVPFTLMMNAINGRNT